MRIVANARTLSAPLTGVQRYASELLRRMPEVEVARPAVPRQGLSGHLWEQAVLPALARGALLWSPANTGPLAHSPQVVTIHDCSALEHPEWYGRSFALLYRALLPELARRARAVIVVSEETRRRLLRCVRLNPAKVRVVHPGVDARFAAEPGDAAPMRAALGLPPGRYLLSVGSLEPRKNLPRLLQAWQRALPRLPEDLQLVLAGGEAAARIFASGGLPSAERVHCCGRVPDEHLPGLYAHAHGFAYLSLYEGFGLPALEALACGVPALVSDRSALPEVVGDAALTADPTHTEAISDGLVRLVTDEPVRTSLRRRGRARAAGFTWDRCAAQTLSVLRESA